MLGSRARVTVVCAALLVGCAAQGDEGFVVLNNSVPDSSCALSGTKDQAFLSNGHILTISPAGYQLFPLLESRIDVADGQDPTTRTIDIRGARIDLSIESVQLTNATGQISNITEQQRSMVDPLLLKFKQLRSGSLPPLGTANIGLEVVPWSLIPQISRGITLAAGDRFRAIVVATVVMYGEMGGDEVTSDRFVYPIEICNDCIANVVGPCPAAVMVAGNPCNPYQDGTVTCCTDQMNRLVCPASTN
jgi:hypothetical protein